MRARDATAVEVRVGERGEEGGGHADDPRHAFDGELAEHLARLRRQHQGEVLVGAQLAGGDDDGAHEQVLERVGALELGRAGR